MSWICSGILATIEPGDFDVVLYKKIGLLFFFGVFAGIGLWLLSVKRGRFDAVARIPLDDLDGSEETAGDTQRPVRGEHG